ncbi:MAG TPA: hypothetical protein VFX95_06525 [Caulobacteraceae bacterium]|nr:hypothetical protein [Caulobacteraceae bacterium]
MSVRTRYIALLIQGAVIWFLAAMFIRFTALAGWMDGGPATMAVFAISLVSSALGIELIHRIVRGEPGEMIRSAAVIALVGAMLDGLALAWTPQLYSPDPALRAVGGAWLLWIVGTILAYALVRDRR